MTERTGVMKTTAPGLSGSTTRRLLTIEMVCYLVMTVIALFAVPSAMAGISAGLVEEPPAEATTFEAVSK